MRTGADARIPPGDAVHDTGDGRVGTGQRLDRGGDGGQGRGLDGDEHGSCLPSSYGSDAGTRAWCSPSIAWAVSPLAWLAAKHPPRAMMDTAGSSVITLICAPFQLARRVSVCGVMPTAYGGRQAGDLDHLAVFIRGLSGTLSRARAALMTRMLRFRMPRSSTRQGVGVSAKFMREASTSRYRRSAAPGVACAATESVTGRGWSGRVHRPR